jgi:hypothetical protein
MEAEKLSKKPAPHSSFLEKDEKAGKVPGNSFLRIIKFMPPSASCGMNAFTTTTAALVTDTKNPASSEGNTDSPEKWLRKRALEEMVNNIENRILHWQQLDPESQEIAEHMLTAALSSSIESWQDLNKNNVAKTLAQKVSESMYQKWLGGGQSIYLDGRGLAAQFFKNSDEVLSVSSLLHTVQELKRAQESSQLLEERRGELVLP